ncbi:MAG: YraN family protein [Chlorobium sp.]|jgi:putative endonuclease|nr:YraN family protein [Chlorobium sp.]
MTDSYAPHLLGQEGEQLAANYLLKKGYRILERNYRYHRNEIDIIARNGQVICFVEVKTRISSSKGDPAEAVTLQKQHEIIKAARAYLALSRQGECDCRFDVVAIRVQRMDGKQISSFAIDHYPDAFWA